jgi:hypothetical protein
LLLQTLLSSAAGAAKRRLARPAGAAGATNSVIDRHEHKTTRLRYFGKAESVAKPSWKNAWNWKPNSTCPPRKSSRVSSRAVFSLLSSFFDIAGPVYDSCVKLIFASCVRLLQGRR